MSSTDDKLSHGSRTYLRRRGRTTPAQARALAELAARYCLGPEGGAIDPEDVYGRDAPFGLEIGFGMGHALIDWALDRPDWNLLGVEIYQPGVGSALLGLERHGIGNVRLIAAPVEPVVEKRLVGACLDEIRVFFPDPWPKKRHHKRRLVQTSFAALLAERLKPGGLMWLATDWDDYGRWMIEVLDAEPLLEREVVGKAEPRGETAAASSRPPTRFEDRGRRLGHAVWDVRYTRKR